MELLSLDSPKHLVPKSLHLREEFFPQLPVLKLLKPLEFFLVLRWSNHRKAIFFFEIVSNQFPDLVLLLDSI